MQVVAEMPVAGTQAVVAGTQAGADHRSLRACCLPPSIIPIQKREPVNTDGAGSDAPPGSRFDAPLLASSRAASLDVEPNSERCPACVTPSRSSHSLTNV